MPTALGQRQRDVLGDGQRLEQREMLEHHADAEPARRGGVGDRDRLALPADLAGGRLQRAVEDLDQRRLAGAVLAEERVDLAGLDGEVDVVVGAERGEVLGDADRLERRLAGGGAGIRCRRWSRRQRPPLSLAGCTPDGSSPPARAAARSASSRTRSSADGRRGDHRRRLRVDAVDADRADQRGDARARRCRPRRSRFSNRARLVFEPIRPT